MSHKCEHGKDSDICVQCWEEKNLEPKDMTTPNQKEESRNAVKAALNVPSPTELDKAIEQTELYKSKPYGGWVIPQSTVDILLAAKRAQELEQQFTARSNAELLGETERCQFEAMKVRLKDVEKERDELIQSRIKSGQNFDQLHTAYKQALESLKVVESAIHGSPYRHSMIKKSLSTPFAIDTMKGKA